MGRCGSLWIVLGSLWVVVDGCGSFWAVPRFSNYEIMANKYTEMGPTCTDNLKLST